MAEQRANREGRRRRPGAAVPGPLVFFFLLVAGLPLLSGCGQLFRAGSAARDDRIAAEFDIRSAASGRWSDPATWQPHRRPGAADRVLIRAGHRVVYDVQDELVIRSIAVAGTLTFARDRDTELNVGVVAVYGTEREIESDDAAVADVHDHGHHGEPLRAGGGALELGTPDEPIPVPFSARIRLHFVEGMNEDNAPALICRPGGRMDFHGAPMDRTWVKLGEPAKPGDTSVTVTQVPSGWRAGDEIVVTASVAEPLAPESDSLSEYVGSEIRRVTAIDGERLILGEPLATQHFGTGRYRSEVADLSRTVIVESAAPDGVRGHTMYHRYSRGSISYARFAHLGKEGVLGRYPIHFHRVADTMRGSSVVGAAVVDSRNRWITIHGTEYLVVRDCIGFGSVGHGYFLEDGTEVYNVLDRNLGVQAHFGRPIKKQALPYDDNEGAAFWWANGRNTFVRNVACENARYGYRYESRTGASFDSHLPVRVADGSRPLTDIRVVPVYRFQENESHTGGRYGFSFVATNVFGSEKVPTRTPLDGLRDATRHPHVLKDLTVWNTVYGLHAELPTMWIQNVDIDHCGYGVYQPWFENQVYKNLRIAHSGEPFNRGLDDYSTQHGSITVDGLALEGIYDEVRFPFIQISDDNLSGSAESHFRNVEVVDAGEERKDSARKPLVDRGGGPRPTPTTEHGVPVYLHDFFGPGRGAKIESTAARDFGADGLAYREVPGVTGEESRLADVGSVDFPQLLKPIDDEPPATIVTWPAAGVPVHAAGGRLLVRGTTTDNVKTGRVTVNGVDAAPVDDDFLQWQAELSGVSPGALKITAVAEDAAGNVEQTPHVLSVEVR
jgi:hypothetical protein